MSRVIAAAPPSPPPTPRGAVPSICRSKTYSGSCNNRGGTCVRGDVCGINVYGHRGQDEGQTCTKACATMGLGCITGMEGGNNCECRFFDNVRQRFSCNQNLRHQHALGHQAHFWCRCGVPPTPPPVKLNDCSATGFPTTKDAKCPSKCAKTLEPFWDACHKTLNALQLIPQSMNGFYDKCMTTLYAPGSCGTGCSLNNYHCRVMEVNQACCSSKSNCPVTKSTPAVCDIGCSLIFPSFQKECSSFIKAAVPKGAGQPAKTMLEYKAFAHSCANQHPADVLNYAHALMDKGCKLQLPKAKGHVVLDEHVHTKLETGKIWHHASEKCSTFREMLDRIHSAHQACCPKGVDCSHGFPHMCSAECAVIFHGMYSACGLLLNGMLPAHVQLMYGAFDAQCTSEKGMDVAAFQDAISKAKCCTPDACACPDETSCVAAAKKDTDLSRICSWSKTKGCQEVSCFTSCAQARHAKSGRYKLCDGTEVYCENKLRGGGWTLLLKTSSKDSRTFEYKSVHWRTSTTLNPGDVSTKPADAKYAAFNKQKFTEWMAVFSTIPGPKNHWHIPKNVAGGPSTALQFFQRYKELGSLYQQNNLGSQWISSERSFRRHAVNHHQGNTQCRWCYVFNEEANNPSTSDAMMGIGLAQMWSAPPCSSCDSYNCCGSQAPAPGHPRRNHHATYPVLLYGRDIAGTAGRRRQLVDNWGGYGRRGFMLPSNTSSDDATRVVV